jgi:hypothetical protein
MGMIMNANDLLGSWTLGTTTITASYLDVDTIRLENSFGEVWTTSDDGWSEMIDTIRDAGGHRV